MTRMLAQVGATTLAWCIATGAAAQVGPTGGATAPSSGVDAGRQATADAAQAAPGSGADNGNTLADIVVTARKRAERLADVPISISAASAETLANAGVTDTADLAKIAPGFVATQTATAVPVYTIRGVGYYDSSLGATPAVTVYNDQVPLAYPSMARNAVYDLERVEVLKGPQGTLFGQNSTGGAINYVAAKPTHTTQAGFNVTVGRFDQVNAEAFVSGPLTDTLSIRIAGGHESRGDWQRSYTRPSDTRGAVDISKGRLLLAWEPSTRLRAMFAASGWIDKSDTQAPQFIAKTSNLPQVAAFLAYPLSPRTSRAADWSPEFRKARNDSLYQLSLRLDYDLTDKVTLTSVSAYTKLKLDSPIDADGSALAIGNYLDRGFIRSINQELRAEGTFGNTRLIVGGNYSKDRISQNTLLTAGDASTALSSALPGLPIEQIDFLTSQRVRTLAGFGNIEQKVGDMLTLQAGVRYTSDRRDFSGCLADVNGRLGPSIAALANFVLRPAAGIPGTVTIAPNSCVTLDARLQPGIVNDRLQQHNLSFRAGPSLKLGKDTLVYANVSKGYKSGTFPTVGAISASQFRPTNQESVLAYEAGLKTTIAHRVQVSTAGFYYDYRNKQLLGSVIDVVFGPLQQLVNVPKSRLYGAELQITAEPFRGLTLSGGGTYVNSRVSKSFTNFNPYGTPTDFKGEAFPFTPKWQATADAQYSFAVGTGYRAFFGGNLLYSGKTVGAFGAGIPYNANEPQHRSRTGQVPALPVVSNALDINGYVLLDLRAGLETADGVLGLSVWGRNVTNRYYWTNATFVPADNTVRYAGMPATYGVSLRYRFNG